MSEPSGEKYPQPLHPSGRWTKRRKMALSAAIDRGEISVAEAAERYALSPEELAEWRARWRPS